VSLRLLVLGVTVLPLHVTPGLPLAVRAVEILVFLKGHEGLFAVTGTETTSWFRSCPAHV
jgi:hypothetical protein